jgi:hypothetical protein
LQRLFAAFELGGVAHILIVQNMIYFDPVAGVRHNGLFEVFNILVEAIFVFKTLMKN